MESSRQKKMCTDESNTLDFDPFRYSMVVTEHLLNFSAKVMKRLKKNSSIIDISSNSDIFLSENWGELFILMVDIVKNYLSMENI